MEQGGNSGEFALSVLFELGQIPSGSAPEQLFLAFVFQNCQVIEKPLESGEGRMDNIFAQG